MAAGAADNLNKTPEHVAIIMDGNGRWAKARGLSRLEGHKQGVTSVLKTIEAAAAKGVKFLTLYTFSTENWNRPQEEVDGLMRLFISAISIYTSQMMEKGVRLKFVGDRQELPDDVIQSMSQIESKTEKNTTITVMPAINYGGRQEILTAVRTISEKVKNDQLSIDDISIDLFSNHLYTAQVPDPELLIRTSGEFRLSNFLLWQLSYAEFHIVDKFWPEFGAEDFDLAIEDYMNRGRRFGGVQNVKV
ncbi:MAG: isoprenyl transferase [Lentisphaeraceae bacterium]|nr:isoprenyl transferase [Lentisphaeraceae bacterium]